jgi:hypothetical protein
MRWSTLASDKKKAIEPGEHWRIRPGAPRRARQNNKLQFDIRVVLGPALPPGELMARERNMRSTNPSTCGAHMEAIGGAVLRYGLGAILLYYGTVKFTAEEAKAIEPLVAKQSTILVAACGTREARNFQRDRRCGDRDRCADRCPLFIPGFPDASGQNSEGIPKRPERTLGASIRTMSSSGSDNDRIVGCDHCDLLELCRALPVHISLSKSAPCRQRRTVRCRPLSCSR